MGTKTEQVPVTTRKGTVAIPEKLREFDAKEYFGVLATDDAGIPYTSLISYALTPDLKTAIFATPKGTTKYRNILHSPQVALLIDNRSKGKHRLLKTEAITIMGAAKHVRKGKTWEKLAEIFLKKHPDLEAFLNSPTTALVAVQILRCIHVGHFQTLSVWDRK
ncbi:MAG: Pyridoxamine 5'-phosphate oxidase [Syntrophorhabdus sp. PtaU1.Bin002]|nr:MAG: Pyridoxamine 5'-phosphate oxidase [Syntrophorhabdus sp. PtaU1.Bin002]